MEKLKSCTVVDCKHFGLPYKSGGSRAISTLQITHRRLPPKSRKLSFRKLKEHCQGRIRHPATTPGRQAWGWTMLGAPEDIQPQSSVPGLTRTGCSVKQEALFQFPSPTPLPSTHSNTNRDGFCQDHAFLAFSLQGFEEQHANRLWTEQQR